VTASARTLHVHPNTVRQRLGRIERVAGLDLHDEDLLSLELALKLARLHEVRAEGE
jgi:DNA-binding PucR family transcriptional regulator